MTALPFTYFSALFATSLASRELRIAFAIFLILIAIDIARRTLQDKPTITISLPPPFIGVVGAVCGIFSGLFGVGGAIIAVPALTTLFGYTQVAAQGMSLAFAVLSATVTTFAYATKGDVNWLVGLPLAVGGVFAVRYGVDLAHRLPERHLRLVFVAFTLAIGIALLVKAYA
ncbi:MAG TPA: sulfite exporter TauE/SafE family protein [Candidatus Lustribacter sp.]|nr:sulfite exporter TauE/SafE family protein [Candidatus Lustribacter sp.]